MDSQKHGRISGDILLWRDDVQVQLSTLNSCPNVVPPANPLCFSNDTSNVSFEERVCTCPPQCKAPQSNAATTSVSPAIYGAAGGGGAFILVALAFLVIYCCQRRSQAWKIENQVPVAVTKRPSSEQSLISGGLMCFKSGRRENSAASDAPSNSVSSEPSSARYGIVG